MMLLAKVSCPKKLVMRAYRDEEDNFTLRGIDRAVIASDVDASASDIFPLQWMIVEECVEWGGNEKVTPFLELFAKRIRQFRKFLVELLIGA